MKRLLVFLFCLLACGGAWATEAPGDVAVLCYHDVRDDVGGRSIRSPTSLDSRAISVPGIRNSLDAEQYTTSTRNLAAHFDWLRAHGYNVISLQQLIDSRNGKGPLPEKAVLLTFDDGLRSVYATVFPLLKAYGYHAVVAVVGAWVDLPADGMVDNGSHPFFRDDFATWDQLREMQDSGLVEIASHTFDLHRGITANPQNNQIPAAVTHAYRPATHNYESDDEYMQRVRTDLTRNSDEIRSKLGHSPLAIMWPYGEYTSVGDSIAASLGMTASFTLGSHAHFNGAGLQAIPRILMMSNASIWDLSWELEQPEARPVIRAVQVDLDYIYDPDPAQQERNLGLMLDRIKALGPTEVWLQAFADPGGQDSAAAVYFPNHLLPMRADLFSRVAWQLRTRCSVKVYAWMPVLGWRLPDASQEARLQIHPLPGTQAEKPVRLNPFLPESRALIDALYEDMARSVPLSGVLFHDDAILRDTDDLGVAAPAPGPERTRALIEFTRELEAHVRMWRPEIKTARNLFAEPVMHPGSETWYAQSLPSFLEAYDEVALMAMPDLEGAKNPDKWLEQLADKTAEVDGGLDRTVFELQSVDWKTAQQRDISTDAMVSEMRLLQSHGVRQLAYYPDDFIKDHPSLKVLRPEFSASDSLPPNYGGGR
jgi:biofilm PGA synthesis lipoprotein PgaB